MQQKMSEDIVVFLFVNHGHVHCIIIIAIALMT
jgi:hypothetical protein